MAYDKAVDSSFLDSGLSGIADSIRGKTGKSDALSFPDDFITEISGITGGGDESYTGTVAVSGNYGCIFYYVDSGNILSKEFSSKQTITIQKNSSIVIRCFYISISSVSGTNIKTESISSYIYTVYPTADNFSVTVNLICCLAEGTKILLADGSNTKNIEDIAVGDMILSYDLQACSYYQSVVKCLITHENTIDIAEVTFENGMVLTMHAYHPVLTTSGWRSITDYNGYETLEVGDIAVAYGGNQKIVNINRYELENPITTYNIDVTDIDEDPDVDLNDNFIANGIVVHNAGGC